LSLLLGLWNTIALSIDIGYPELEFVLVLIVIMD